MGAEADSCTYATIHGLEESSGTHYLVMELVPGDTLAERIKRDGAVPVEEALGIATQIAEALEHAHEHGIIHRDLKPANVKVTPEGQVKVLDFGLAKGFSADGSDSPDAFDSNSPTLTSPAFTASPTMPGVILGTAAYMSPEQAKGKPVDRRTDIWAFGCVLYELLTSRMTFSGETVTDILGAILHKEPDWEALPASTPQGIRALLRRCLNKEARHRYHAAADVRIQIEEAHVAPAGPIPSDTPPSATLRERFGWIAAVALPTLIAALLALLYFGEKPVPLPLVRTTMLPPQNITLVESSIAVSPWRRCMNQPRLPR